MKRSLFLFIIFIILLSSCGNGNENKPESTRAQPDAATISPGIPPGESAKNTADQANTDNTDNHDNTDNSTNTGMDSVQHPNATSEPGQGSNQTVNPDKEAITDVQQLLKDMTLQEKIGQLFIVAYRQDMQGNPILKLDTNTAESMKKYQPGGVILFAENINTIPQTVKLIDDLQQASEIPLFIAVDEEGGLVSRITKSDQMHATRFPNNAVIGNKKDPDLAYRVAVAIAQEVASLGFNMNFAPVADVNTNPDNPVIGVRAYGSKADVVRKMVAAAVKGFQDNSVSAVMKHFPGHGDTMNDSHYGSASVSHTKERLLQVELLPFIDGIAQEADGIMTAHILTPEIPGENVPATLKPEILTGILRNELGFKGLIITDALNMGAVTEHFNSGEAAVKAIKAGADILLMPEDLKLAISAVQNACSTGEISISRLDESVLRVLETKLKRGLFDQDRNSPNPEEILGNSEHRELADEARR